ncbi:MerR family DNA-binding protein [Nocardioides mesophilus]|uniref:MerR family DNA-binding protein n=1 Tax=Nocardioides mesophilus TaxID=433659 RepID=A0A7G9RDK3_9ACTN|nr:MerR family DNA-binding protein [Nocardioides mesophilus]QNN53678.1 MerR family DNA-binding protein [Nocardioides mesophilus]
MPGPDRTWTITELAQEHDVTLRTLRHYEDVGLLSPERRGTVRVFHLRDRTRLRLILRGRRLGFTLPEIATIVDMYDDQPGESGQLAYLLEQIEGRRTELAQRRRDIDESLAELDEVERRCRDDLARLAGSPQHTGSAPTAG